MSSTGPSSSVRPLRAFPEIGRSGKIVNAAKVLGPTPVAVTRPLKALEDALGLALFGRRAEGMRPTAAGLAAIAAADAIDEQLPVPSDRVDAIKGGAVAFDRGRHRPGLPSARGRVFCRIEFARTLGLRHVFFTVWGQSVLALNVAVAWRNASCAR